MEDLCYSHRHLCRVVLQSRSIKDLLLHGRLHHHTLELARKSARAQGHHWDETQLLVILRHLQRLSTRLRLHSCQNIFGSRRKPNGELPNNRPTIVGNVTMILAQDEFTTWTHGGITTLLLSMDVAAIRTRGITLKE